MRRGLANGDRNRTGITDYDGELYATYWNNIRAMALERNLCGKSYMR